MRSYLSPSRPLRCSCTLLVVPGLASLLTDAQACLPHPRMTSSGVCFCSSLCNSSSSLMSLLSSSLLNIVYQLAHHLLCFPCSCSTYSATYVYNLFNFLQRVTHCGSAAGTALVAWSLRSIAYIPLPDMYLAVVIVSGCVQYGESRYDHIYSYL